MLNKFFLLPHFVLHSHCYYKHSVVRLELRVGNII